MRPNIRLVCVAVLAILFALGQQSELQAELDPDITFLMHFEGNSLEEVNQINGVEVGTVSYTSGISGTQGVQFDGKSQVKFTPPAGVTFIDPQQGTVTCWVKFTGHGSNQFLFSTWGKGEHGSEDSFSIMRYDATGLGSDLGYRYIMFRVEAGPYDPTAHVVSYVGVPDNTWAHFAMTWSSSGEDVTGNLYLNGDKIKEYIKPSHPGALDLLNVGNLVSLAYESDMIIDELTIQNRVMSELEISTLANPVPAADAGPR